MKIVLAAQDEALAVAWEHHFSGLDDVTVFRGSILESGCQAVVSPANSFGFMDGGLDALYLKYFGDTLQDRVRREIRDVHGAELLVGHACVVKTSHPRIHFLVVAPTMRVPMVLKESVNPYLATRVALWVARQWRAGIITSLAFPGMGTGVGRVPFDICAKQMRAAYDDFKTPWFPTMIGEAQAKHSLLFGNEIRDLQMPERQIRDEVVRRRALKASEKLPDYAWE
jgi:O-acetyl-ADP-ribose deacetylase (regulator of RNase III)